MVAGGLNDVIQAGVVKVAVPSDFPPFGSIGKDRQLEGYDIDVARLLARDLGVKLELVPVSMRTASRTCNSAGSTS